MRFSLFSVLDYYEDGSRTLSTLYAQLLDIRHAQHHVHQLEERKQLWFGTPDDLIQWIKQYQANIDSRHFVFWLNFGGMQPASIHRSMYLLTQEVMPHFSIQVSWMFAIDNPSYPYLEVELEALHDGTSMRNWYTWSDPSCMVEQAPYLLLSPETEATQSYLAAGALETEVVEHKYMNNGPLPVARSVPNEAEEVDLLARFLPGAAHEFRLGLGSCAVFCPTEKSGEAIAAHIDGVRSKVLESWELISW